MRNQQQLETSGRKEAIESKRERERKGLIESESVKRSM